LQGSGLRSILGDEMARFTPKNRGVGVFCVQAQRYQLVTFQIRGRKSGFSAVFVRFLAADRVRANSLAALAIWAWALGSDCPWVAWRNAEFWVAVLQFRLGLTPVRFSSLADLLLIIMRVEVEIVRNWGESGGSGLRIPVNPTLRKVREGWGTLYCGAQENGCGVCHPPVAQSRIMLGRVGYCEHFLTKLTSTSFNHPHQAPRSLQEPRPAKTSLGSVCCALRDEEANLYL